MCIPEPGGPISPLYGGFQTGIVTSKAYRPSFYEACSSKKHRFKRPGTGFSPSAPYPSPSPSSHGPEADFDLPETRERRLWELRLFHNQQTEMIQVFPTPQSNAILRLWSHVMPGMALRDGGALLHIILANSALNMWHKSASQDEREQLMALQTHYLTLCFQEQRRDVANLSSKNADYVCFTSLKIVSHSVALVQTLSLEPWEPPLQWLHMGRGADEIFRMAADLVNPEDGNQIITFLKSPPALTEEDTTSYDRSRLEWLLEHPAGRDSVEARRDHELDDMEVRSAYEKAISYTCSVRGAIERAEPVFSIVRRLAAFSVFVPTGFIQLLAEKRPRAMVILAHFMALWLDYEHIWLIGKGGERQIRGILMNLPPEWHWMESSPDARPPKRKAATTTSEAPKERQSKLAKEHNISAGQEREIKEAFALFAEPMEGEKEGVIPTGDVRRAMVALGIPPTKSELQEFVSILDPDEEGFACYEPFVAICALKLHAKEDEDEEDEGETHRREVDEAFRLFTGGGSGGEGEADQLTLAHLKRVAMTLKQDVDEALLRDMILEANGGAGVGRGVSRAEFDEVMRRAGAWK
ncbi:hypothetical protein DL770_010432 [Monosporascus sp. CRB-9-2]|nr:hypothetical protein DL770_010432 [Monosporascus sp. CRB-9-2]